MSQHFFYMANTSSQIIGGWWYYSCHRANLNGLWCTNGTCDNIATGACWESWKGWDYAMKIVDMKISR